MDILEKKGRQDTAAEGFEGQSFVLAVRKSQSRDLKEGTVRSKPQERTTWHDCLGLWKATQFW